MKAKLDTMRMCLECLTNLHTLMFKNDEEVICKECSVKHERQRRAYIGQLTLDDREVFGIDKSLYPTKSQIEMYLKRINDRGWSYLCGLAKIRAKKQGVPFDLGPEDNIMPKDLKDLICADCQRPLLFRIGHIEANSSSPTLDKQKPELGYVPGNIAILCSVCNRRKDNHTTLSTKSMIIYQHTYEPEKVETMVRELAEEFGYRMIKDDKICKE